MNAVKKEGTTKKRRRKKKIKKTIDDTNWRKGRAGQGRVRC